MDAIAGLWQDHAIMRHDHGGCGGCAASRHDRSSAVLRLLLGLALLVQQLFLPGQLPVARAGALIEICTAEGVRLVALADDGGTRQNRQRDHAGHECPGCLTFCCKLLPCAGTVAALLPEQPATADDLVPGRGLAAFPAAPRPAFQARAPPPLAQA